MRRSIPYLGKAGVLPDVCIYPIPPDSGNWGLPLHGSPQFLYNAFTLLSADCHENSVCMQAVFPG